MQKLEDLCSEKDALKKLKYIRFFMQIWMISFKLHWSTVRLTLPVKINNSNTHITTLYDHLKQPHLMVLQAWSLQHPSQKTSLEYPLTWLISFTFIAQFEKVSVVCSGIYLFKTLHRVYFVFIRGLLIK